MTQYDQYLSSIYLASFLPGTWYLNHTNFLVCRWLPFVSASTPLYTTQPCASKTRRAVSQDTVSYAAHLPSLKVDKLVDWENHKINRKPTLTHVKTLHGYENCSFLNRLEFVIPGRWRRSSSMTSSSHPKRERHGTAWCIDAEMGMFPFPKF